MRLLLLTTYFPLPPDNGGVVRALGLTSALSQEHDLHLLAQGRDSTRPGLVAALREAIPAPVEVFPMRASARRGPLALARRWIEAIVRGIPPWVLGERNEALEYRALELAPEFDAVITLDDQASVYALATCGLTRVVIDKQNVTGWSVAERGRVGAGPRAWLHHRLSLRLARAFERQTACSADMIVFNSEAEAARFRSLYGDVSHAIVPSAVELPPPRHGMPSGRRVAWLGALDYYANVNGLIDFVQTGWQSLGRSGAELLVIGGHAPPEIQALEQVPGIRLLGYVDDLNRVLGEASAAIVPLWQGAGVKLKTLTLMAAGLPTVSTSVGMEGIEAVDGTHCLIRESPATLAEALDRLLHDDRLRARLAERGRSLVEDRYTWTTVAPRFAAALATVALQRPPSRCADAPPRDLHVPIIDGGKPGPSRRP